jgi:hypothetical protein
MDKDLLSEYDTMLTRILKILNNIILFIQLDMSTLNSNHKINTIYLICNREDRSNNTLT